MPQRAPRTTVVVVTWRGREHLGDCLTALAAQDSPHRTLVVDNASDDGTAEIIDAHVAGADGSPIEVVRLPKNRGYAGGIAAALPRVGTEFVAWLNDDAAPETGWLTALEAAIDSARDVAAVTSRLVRPDGTTQSAGVRITADGYGADLADPVVESHAVFGFCGGAALLRTAELRAAGGVPASYFCYYEDTDTAWRLRLNGWQVRFAADAVVVHLHGASTRPGSAAFHRWNERNRLLTLIRCAPGVVAFREVARFTAITAMLPIRRVAALLRGGAGATPANLRPGLRLRVLAEVVARLPAALLNRGRIGRSAAGSRVPVWRAWSGR